MNEEILAEEEYRRVSGRDALVPGALGARETFAKALKDRNPRTDSNFVNRVLERVPEYGRFRNPIWRFPRRRVLANYVGEVMQADLAHIPDITRGRQNPGLLLVLVDTVSRFVLVRPLRRKTSDETASALRDAFQEFGRAPKILFTDRGSEFTGPGVRELLKERKVAHWTSSGGSPNKAPLAENKIRQLKRLLYRYISRKRAPTIRGPVLSGIQNIMNATPSRVLTRRHYAPTQVHHRASELGPLVVAYDRERHRLAMGEGRKGKKTGFSFDLGQFVRIQKRKDEKTAGMSKAVRGVMSAEVFVIAGRLATFPSTYKVRDSTGRMLLYRVYSREMVPASKDTSQELPPDDEKNNVDDDDDI